MPVFVTLSNRSRYKDTIIYDGDRGPEFGLFAAPEEFSVSRLDDTIHRVVSSEIGFLDKLAVRYYGPGYERLWWVIAQANAMLDPELEMFAGQELRIPPRRSLTAFVARVGEGV